MFGEYVVVHSFSRMTIFVTDSLFNIKQGLGFHENGFRNHRIFKETYQLHETHLLFENDCNTLKRFFFDIEDLSRDETASERDLFTESTVECHRRLKYYPASDVYLHLQISSSDLRCLIKHINFSKLRLGPSLAKICSKS